MAQTVVGLFDNEKDAQQAVQQLFNDGFTDANVDINTRCDDTNRTTESNYKDSDKENGIVKFFNNLFGTNDEADKYSRVAERCSSIVTVHAESDHEAERAADLLDLYGAVDVDQKASEFGYNYKSQNYNRNFDDVDSDFSRGRTNYDADLTDTNIVGSARERFNAEERSNFHSEDLEKNPDTRMEGDIDRTAYQRREDRNFEMEDTNLTRSEMPRDYVDSDEKSLPVVEENINLDKREVETGGVRLRSRIVERPVEENLRLRQERVRVERNPVNREATESDFRNFQEGEIELTERGEVAQVSKEARVVEEVRLRKEVEDRNETVRDTVRKTEVDVEEFRNEDDLKRRDNF